MTPVRLEPVAPRSRVKHSNTEPLRSLRIAYSTRKYFCPVGINMLGLLSRDSELEVFGNGIE